MDADTLFYIFINIVLILIVGLQITKSREIKIYTKLSKTDYLTFVLGFLFPTGAILLGEDIFLYTSGFLVFVIYILMPFTSGLAEDYIIYRPNRTGLSGTVPKKVKFKDINKVNLNNTKNHIELKIKTNFAVKELQFKKSDYQKIKKLLNENNIAID